MHSFGWWGSCVVERRGKEVHREAEPCKDGGRKRWRRHWGEAGSVDADIRHWKQRGATTHRFKASARPEEEGSQEGGGQGTEEYGGRTVPKA